MRSIIDSRMAELGVPLAEADTEPPPLLPQLANLTTHELEWHRAAQLRIADRHSREGTTTRARDDSSSSRHGHPVRDKQSAAGDTALSSRDDRHWSLSGAQDRTRERDIAHRDSTRNRAHNNSRETGRDASRRDSSRFDARTPPRALRRDASDVEQVPFVKRRREDTDRSRHRSQHDRHHTGEEALGTQPGQREDKVGLHHDADLADSGAATVGAGPEAATLRINTQDPPLPPGPPVGPAPRHHTDPLSEEEGEVSLDTLAAPPVHSSNFLIGEQLPAPSRSHRRSRSPRDRSSSDLPVHEHTGRGKPERHRDGTPSRLPSRGSTRRSRSRSRSRERSPGQRHRHHRRHRRDQRD